MFTMNKGKIESREEEGNRRTYGWSTTERWRSLKLAYIILAFFPAGRTSGGNGGVALNKTE